MRVLGVDPGLAHLGFASLEKTSEGTRILDAGIIRTSKSTHKARKATDDDLDRARILWLNVNQQVCRFEPVAIGVETYTVFRPTQGGHGKGAGWKALYSFGMALAVGFEHGLAVYTFRPTEMKRSLVGSTGASKEDVEEAVRRHVTNLDEFLDQVPDAEHEHLADAAAHALMTLRRHERA